MKFGIIETGAKQLYKVFTSLLVQEIDHETNSYVKGLHHSSLNSQSLNYN